MNIVIIPEDKMIGVDGEFHKFDFSIATNIHAIHWDGTKGEIEFKNKKSEVLKDFTPYQPLLEARTLSMDNEAQVKLDEKDASDAQKIIDAADAEAARTPLDRRRAEYPDVASHLYALYKARKGDAIDLNSIDAVYAAVDLKYPL